MFSQAKVKRFLYAFIPITISFILMASFAMLPVQAVTPPQPQSAPMLPPPEQPPPIVDGHGTGFLPSQMDLSHLTGEEMPERFMAGEPPVGEPPVGQPASFDWRAYDGGRVTSVKDQGACGSCYAFAAIANFESEMLIDGDATLPDPDYSEENAMECNWREINNYVDLGGYSWGGCSGGNYLMLASLFSQKGVVLESDDPYDAVDTDACDGTCAGGNPCQKTLLDWRMISGNVVPETTVLKNYIYEQASPVYTSVWVGHLTTDPTWLAEFGAYNGTYTLYYPSCPFYPNHAVLIVGWDDSLVHDGGTGGWIVKNSWGTGWGGTCGYGTEGGYFTIAYGSANIGMWSSYMYDWQDYNPYGGIMYYDDDCWSNSYGQVGGANTTGWGLCQFIPPSDTYVTRVEFWTTDITTDVDVYIYDNFDGSSLTDLLWSSTDHSYAEAGYHGVALSPPLAVTSGDDVIAVVKFTNSSYGFPVAVDDVGTPIESNLTYMSLDGSTWFEMGIGYGVDVAIRLRTSGMPDLEVTEKYEEWVDPVAGTYNIHYTVTNTGDGSAGACSTRIEIDGGGPTYVSCPALDPGNFYSDMAGPIPMTGASDTIEVCADSYDEVIESDEDNNCVSNDFGEVLEYGDAPDNDPAYAPLDYPSLAISDGARHYPTDTECLGLWYTNSEWKDYETDAKVTDLDNLYDDGLVTTTIAAGDPAATVTFEVTDLLGEGNLYVNILLDLNADGDWLDTVGTQSEHIVQNQVITGGGEQTVTSIPTFSTVGAVAGPTWLRITLSRSEIPPGYLPWDGTMEFNDREPFDFGETEDYEIDIFADYGDAPYDGVTFFYPSLLAQDGARHAYTDTECLGLVSLGEWKDFEPDARVTDLDSPFDDGLVTTTITAGKLDETVTFEVTDYLWQEPNLVVNILIDLNADGDWADYGEHAVVNQHILTTALEGVFTSTPFSTVGATPGPTWLRITLTRSDLDTTNPWDGTMTGYATTIPFEYGETEDWLITMNPPPEPEVTICTPPVFELTLMPGESATETKTVDLAPMPIPKADIVFAFDLTGSMSPDLAVVKAQAINIMTALSALIPDVYFAVMSYMDYPEYYDYCGYDATYGDPTAGDYAYSLDQALTNNTTAVSNAINALTLGFGADSPEDYTRIMYESYAELIGETNPTYGAVGYRPGAKKILINFADDVPHDCDLNEGVPGKVGTWTTGGDPGRDEIMGNADDLDLQATLAAMASNRVTLLQVHSRGYALEYWQYWAGLTGGAVFDLTDPAGIPDAVYTLVQAEVSVIELLTLHVQPEGYAGWVTWVPQQYTNVSGGETKTFSIIYTVPEDTPAGDYKFEVKLIGDDVILCRQTVTIHVVIEEEIAPARLIVRNLRIEPTQVYPNQLLTISADVINQGGVRGSKRIDLVINGQAEQAIRVGVDPGSAQHITFTTAKSVPGRYEVFIEGQASAFNVLLGARAPAAGAAGGLGTTGTIAVIVIGVILIGGIIVAIVFARRRA